MDLRTGGDKPSVVRSGWSGTLVGKPRLSENSPFLLTTRAKNNPIRRPLRGGFHSASCFQGFRPPMADSTPGYSPWPRWGQIRGVSGTSSRTLRIPLLRENNCRTGSYKARVARGGWGATLVGKPPVARGGSGSSGDCARLSYRKSTCRGCGPEYAH